MFIDDQRRLLFCSNYDGSLDSYMDDFINKVAFGLNLVFSNGIGYPRTDFLLCRRRARTSRQFKYYLRRHQVPTQVWYKAYPGLTAADLARNTHDPRRAGARRDDRRRGAALAGDDLNQRHDILQTPKSPISRACLRSGYGSLTEACFLLLRVTDAAAARAWLAQPRRSPRSHT